MLILLALAIGILRGVMTGAVRQVMSFLGTIVAIIFAVELMNPVGGIVGSALGMPDGFHPAVGLLVVFLVLQIILFFVVRATEALIKVFRLNTANRVVGGVVGLGKAALLLSVLFVILAFFDVPEREDRRTSTLYPLIAGVLPVTWDFVSERLPVIKSLSDRMGREAREVLEGRPAPPEQP